MAKLKATREAEEAAATKEKAMLDVDSLLGLKRVVSTSAEEPSQAMRDQIQKLQDTVDQWVTSGVLTEAEAKIDNDTSLDIDGMIESGHEEDEEEEEDEERTAEKSPATGSESDVQSSDTG